MNNESEVQYKLNKNMVINHTTTYIASCKSENTKEVFYFAV